MNSLVIFVATLSVAFSAPQFSGVPLGHHPFAFSAAAIPTVQVHQPVVQTVQVPLTKTVHYELKPQVVGYSSTIVKPAIATQTIAQPLAVAAGYNPFPNSQISLLRQLPEFPQEAPPVPDAPQIPNPPPAPQPPMGGGDNSSNSILSPFPELPSGLPIQSLPSFPSEIPLPSLPVQTLPTLPIQIQQPQQYFNLAPAHAVVETRAALPAPVAVAQPAPVAIAAPAPVLVKNEAALYEPLVTKEQVLAPVRSHQVITPQVTQVQPEVTVRKVITDVPVQQVVGVNQPIINQVQHFPTFQQVHAPAFQQVAAFPTQTLVAGGPVHGATVVGAEPQIISA